MAAIELDMRRIGREAPRFAGSVAELARWLHDHVVPHRSLTTFLFVFDCIKKMPLTEPDIHECKTTDQAAAVIRRFLGRVQLAAVSGEFTFEERWVRDACGVLCRNALARGY